MTRPRRRTSRVAPFRVDIGGLFGTLCSKDVLEVKCAQLTLGETWQATPSATQRRSETKGNRREYDGFIKVRLGHSVGKSYLIPDVLIGVGGTRYFLPSFFTAPYLGFNVEEGRHRAVFSMDVGPPRAGKLERIIVTVRSEDRLLSYDDGAQLYRCTFEGPRTIVRFATGLCRSLPGGDFALELFHHTKPESASKIRASCELWSSSWNLAGTRKLTNVAYGYFTSLPRIETKQDLQRVAMSSDGEIQLQTTSDRVQEEVLTLKVYRGNTDDRRSPIALHVPSAIIAPPHLYFHMPPGGDPAYYEVVGTEVLRVGVNPNAVLRLSRRDVQVPPGDLRCFDNVVLGDASTIEGLAAPFNEEGTLEVTHLERLDKSVDLFQFWLRHQNTDLVSGRAFEERSFTPS